MTYRHTLSACYLGYVTQAICNNLPPLLFVTFNERFGVSHGAAGAAGIHQLCHPDSWWTCSRARYVDRIGHRRALVLAQALATLGLVLLGILPYVLSNGFVAILIPIALGAVGGGLLEVLVSPIVESLPRRAQGKGHEPAAFLLLLGACGGGSSSPRPISPWRAWTTGAFCPSSGRSCLS